MFGKLRRAKSTPALAHAAWGAVRAEYQAVAASPADHNAWARLAGRLTATCMLPPAVAVNGKPYPPGFTQRPDGGTQDCLLTARALELHGSLVAAGVHPSLLLPMRAQLRYGWRQYDEAVADLEAAGRQIPADHPSPDREQREFDELTAACHAAARVETPPPHAVEAKIRQGVGIATRGVVRLLDFAPGGNVYHPRGHAIERELDARLVALDREFSAHGLAHLAWTDHVGASERLGKRLISGFWAGPDGAYGVSAGVTANGTRSTSAISQLSDGRIVETTVGRGRTYYARGPWVDLLQIDATEPLRDLLALHLARLSMATATSGAFWMPLDTVDALGRMRELERGYALEHRLEQGLSEAEARAHPFTHPQFTVPLLRRAARDAVQAAAHGRTAA